jgi:hypothetical protein
MQLRIPLIDLYAAPGFLDASGETAPVLDAARISQLYSFLPPHTSFALDSESLVVSRSAGRSHGAFRTGGKTGARRRPRQGR